MVSEPQKELRFTRSGQGLTFCIVGAVFVGIGVIVLATGLYRDINPELPHPAWSLLSFLLAAVAFWIARHLTRHAYLILTPLGFEIFPFFRPAQGMQLVMWQQVAAAEFDEKRRWMTLHYNDERTAGIHLSLRPIRRKLRELLITAVLGRVKS